MGVKADIDAVLADPTLTPQQKQSRIYSIKTTALLPYLQSLEGKTISRTIKGVACSLTVVRAWERVEGEKSWLCAHIVAAKNGQPQPLPGGNPIMFLNPPIGGPGDAADLIAAAQDLVMSIFR